MKQKIKSITEAFSMQPRMISICETNKKLPFGQSDLVAEINREIHYPIVNGEQNGYEMYVGYNFEGDIIFEYLATTVNVHYYYE